ncbi:hypothetical protein [Absidia glauca]|uniref:Uncharacterized protein n=1 Tax=Absidia glauca TaxID=4829 RepID=A0A168NG78_ABSGL|nr:hypothetical protein [Absidia glauca]
MLEDGPVCGQDDQCKSVCKAYAEKWTVTLKGYNCHRCSRRINMFCKCKLTGPIDEEKYFDYDSIFECRR